MDNEHEFKQSLLVDIWYPDHPPRTESETFIQTKKFFDDENAPCFICGSTDNREIHHRLVEWSFADGVDWDRMKTLYGDFDWTKFTKPEDFVDSPYNCIPLCALHHRMKDHGVHNLPWPIWIMQKHARSDFQLFGDPTIVVSANASATVAKPKKKKGLLAKLLGK